MQIYEFGATTLRRTSVKACSTMIIKIPSTTN